MFFNIDADTGSAISGWLAPDNPSAVPNIAIVVPGRGEIRLIAKLRRPDICDLGLHTTGEVGFHVDSAIVPGIASLDDIEILDADTRTPLYRRFNAAKHIERKFFLFDCSVMPQRDLLSDLSSNFALSYRNAERYSLETMIVLISNQFSKSIFFSGRSNFNRYAGFLENGGFIRAALLRDPIEEMAERLLFLNFFSRKATAEQLADYTVGVVPLIEFVRDLQLTDPKALLAAFRRLTDDQRRALSSPMVRMFGASVDEPPTHNDVSLALDRLATLDVVGTRASFPAFRAVLAQLLGRQVLNESPPPSFPAVQGLASLLSRIGIAVDLLQFDIALYSYVEEAIAEGLGRRGTLATRDVHTI